MTEERRHCDQCHVLPSKTMSDEPISFSSESIKLQREKRVAAYREILEGDFQADVDAAIALLEENGYVVIKPNEH